MNNQKNSKTSSNSMGAIFYYVIIEFFSFAMLFRHEQSPITFVVNLTVNYTEIFN